ncbi:MAG: ABC transporter ATP-binding protein [Planctomycetota bacterium]|jgi:ABC-2 type transport system ATP-binding protein
MPSEDSGAGASGTAAIRCSGVTKRFGAFTAVDALDFTVQPGTVCGFLGQNGAGKTTTMRMLVGIYAADAGTLEVLGHAQPAEVRHRIGYLPEEKGLYKKMRAAEVIAYFGKLKGMDRGAANRAARDLLERFGLGEWAGKKVETLSKGMGQKVQFLGTLIHDPELLILDEPFSGLDPVNRQVMLDGITQVKQEGKTVLFSTHVMEHAEQLCDTVMMIHQGVKRLDGPVGAIKGAVRTIRLEFEGDGAVLSSLPEVAAVTMVGQTAEVELAVGADPAALLAAVNDRLALRLFDRREPSLQEIFIRTVREAEGGAVDAT